VEIFVSAERVVTKRGFAATIKRNGIERHGGDGGMATTKIAREFGITLKFVRESLGVSQAKLGELSGISPNLINDYEHFRKPLTRERLEVLLSFLGVPPERLEATLACLEANRAASQAALEPAASQSSTHRRIETVVQQAGGLAMDFARGLLTLLTLEGEGLQARERAEALWEKLKRRPPEGRLLLVEDSRKYRTWALCERVAAASIEAAGDDPKEAVRLAQLAVRIGELCPGPEAWRWRLEGYAGVHLANARRAAGEMPPAREAMARGKKLWQAGAPADPGLLNEALVLGLEANLLRADRRFGEAIKLVEQAIRTDRSGITARLLFTKARILEGMDDFLGSAATLEKAARHVDAKREPRLAQGIHCQLIVNFCLENRATETQQHLRELRLIVEGNGKELDLARVLWLEGMAAAGTGQSTAAEVKLQQVRREMARREIAYDYALVTLELAVVLLAESRTGEVRSLAADLVWIFRSQQVHENALAALRLFAEAARREIATVGFARQVRRFLYRAQHDPVLEFKEAGAGG
jgi:transcriptional regulator with XRE-family HTH domain